MNRCDLSFRFESQIRFFFVSSWSQSSGCKSFPIDDDDKNSKLRLFEWKKELRLFLSVWRHTSSRITWQWRPRNTWGVTSLRPTFLGFAFLRNRDWNWECPFLNLQFPVLNPQFPVGVTFVTLQVLREWWRPFANRLSIWRF